MIWLFFLVLAGCMKTPQEPQLTVINIIDNNGMSETISAEERLKQYENVDFLSCQPYKKVMRIYSRDACGTVAANILSYHPNGQPWQYLEIENGRAFGTYQEWYPSGHLKIRANVIGGEPDVTVDAEKTWLFEGLNEVWDEEGRKIALLPYSKGYLEGVSTYYHPSGALWKSLPYSQGKLQGVQQTFRENGELLLETSYSDDLQEGATKRYWTKDTLASEELFCKGKLIAGSYWDKNGKLISEVAQGTGKRTLFGKDTVAEIHEIQNGLPEGKVELYTPRGTLASYHYLKDGVKHGEEVLFFPGTLDPKLCLTWYQGKIQGSTRTWYPNGQLESQKEMSENKKNGVLTAWYTDGSLMLIEEYDHDKLLRGEYFRKGETRPISEVMAGKGTATLFSHDGQFLKRVAYQNGHPEI